MDSTDYNERWEEDQQQAEQYIIDTVGVSSDLFKVKIVSKSRARKEIQVTTLGPDAEDIAYEIFSNDGEDFLEYMSYSFPSTTYALKIIWDSDQESVESDDSKDIERQEGIKLSDALNYPDTEDDEDTFDMDSVERQYEEEGLNITNIYDEYGNEVEEEYEDDDEDDYSDLDGVDGISEEEDYVPDIYDELTMYHELDCDDEEDEE